MDNTPDIPEEPWAEQDYIEGEVVPLEPDKMRDEFGLGDLIKSHRLFAKWSQEDLARESGLQREQIQRFETGKIKKPQKFNLERMADAFARRWPDTPAEQFLADFYAALGHRPASAKVDPEAQFLSARLRPYSSALKKIAYRMIDALLSGIEDVRRLGGS